MTEQQNYEKESDFVAFNLFLELFSSSPIFRFTMSVELIKMSVELIKQQADLKISPPQKNLCRPQKGQQELHLRA